LLHNQARLLTVREVAGVLGISLPIVYRLCERNELPHVRVSNAIRISPLAVIPYLRHRQP
jgi:excisionase family DNA binding protein